MSKRMKALSSVETPGRAVVDRTAWLEAAREALIESGIDSVKIEPLALRLEISRSSFYWHFKNRRDLLDALLTHWKDVNENALREAVERQELTKEDPETVARVRLQLLTDLFIYETTFSSKFDLAVREWARKDTSVAQEVTRIDKERIALFQKIFLDVGYSTFDSLARAKILYFHQIGYYIVDLKESTAVRQRIARRYLEILSGLKFS
jgi:AcrR family transcriptional regulator